MSRLPSAAGALMVLSLACAPARAEDLKSYATKCDAAIGVSVPDFDCNDNTFTEVPEGNNNGKPYGNHVRKCDFPNVLNHECDPGSRFKVLKEDDNVAIVAHCRRQSTDPDEKTFGDIAVIQYNKKNGATCFYQQLDDPNNPQHNTRLPGKVNAPIGGDTTWYTPAATENIKCGECHDNGPFIRSPYLAHLKDVAGAQNVLPGSHMDSFNSEVWPYAFVGEDFKDWKAWQIQAAGTPCNDCHRMGVSNMKTKDFADPRVPYGRVFGIGTPPCDIKSREGGGGTARILGITATLDRQCDKNPHSAASPIWMTPGQIVFRDASGDKPQAIHNLLDANKIRKCALAFVGNNFDETKPLPKGCSVKLFAQAFSP
ncbi:MAG: hypothetical protein JO261_07855 [Alphaproteobacteria bacterium]|nr:hypothetical protein [Alphaproteobacteria bacterium]MBV9693598.1 hypothetical protein [Alphaproteobacteria bacterium]